MKKISIILAAIAIFCQVSLADKSVAIGVTRIYTMTQWVGFMTNNFNKIGGENQQKLIKFVLDSAHGKLDGTVPDALVVSTLKTYATQEWFDKFLSFPTCCWSFYNGIIVPDGLDKELTSRYEKALVKAGRPSAVKIYKQFKRKPSIESLKQFMTLDETVEYMNTEMYWEIHTVATHIALKMFYAKRDQLIDNGYPVHREYKGNKASDGAVALSHYMDEVVAAVNGPYMFGLNTKLKEIGCNKKFNPVYRMTSDEVNKISYDFIHWKIDLIDKQRWNMILAMGVQHFNEMLDFKLKGDAKLRAKTGNDASKVRAE